MGDNSTILRTEDGGKNWVKVTSTILSETKTYFQAVVLTDATTGVAVGGDGTILRTEDEGKSWKRTTTPSGINSALWAVAFTGVATGVAVGDGGVILWSRDNGTTWSQVAELSHISKARLCCVAFGGSTGPAIIVGARGVRVVTVAANYAAYLNHPEHSVRIGLKGTVNLDLQAIDEEGYEVRVSGIEYNVVRKNRDADWKRLPLVPTKSESDGHWRVNWSSE